MIQLFTHDDFKESPSSVSLLLLAMRLYEAAASVAVKWGAENCTL